MSQSIKSDRISESTIARMAGNMASLGFDGRDVLRIGQHGITTDDPLVVGTVALARALAAQVERTGPADLVPGDAFAMVIKEVVAFVRDMRDNVLDAHALESGRHNPFTFIADRIDEHFQDALRDTLTPLQACEALAGPGGTFKVPLLRSTPPAPEHAAHVLELPPSEAYKLGWHDAKADTSEQQEQHRESGSAGPDPTPERQARDLLLRLGVAGEWSSGDLVELANLFAENRRLQVARIGDSETIGRLMCEQDRLQAALAQRRRDEDAPLPDDPLTVPVQVCLGCNRQTGGSPRDCGCPAGTGMRTVNAISEQEYRQKAKAVRAALLGPGVPDPGHPPTAEMAKDLRLKFEQSVRRAAVQDTHVADLRAEVKRLGDLLQTQREKHEQAESESGVLVVAAEAEAKELKAHLADALSQRDAVQDRWTKLHADAYVAHRWFSETFGEQVDGRDFAVKCDMATGLLREREGKAVARALRNSAEEIENSLRTPVVPDRELLQNCVAWYRAQADNLDPTAGQLRKEIEAFTGGRPVPRCPSCSSPDRARHPAVQHGGEVQPCPDPWHGVPRDARLFVGGRRGGGKADGLRLHLARFDGCPVCNANEDGANLYELLERRGFSPRAAQALVDGKEPHMAICEALGFPHDHKDIR